VVDLTWVSLNLVGHVADWRVREEIESLSDHRYISYSLNPGIVVPRGKIQGPRCNLRKLDSDMLLDSIYWSCAVRPSVLESDNVNPGL